MRKQGSEYLRCYGSIWNFLSGIQKKGYKMSKTQFFLNKELILDNKISSKELIEEVYKIDEEKYLRYDLTVPWKNYLESRTNQPSVIKRYQIGQVFRKGPRKGKRYRNFTQLDLEICSKKKYCTKELLNDFFDLLKPIESQLILKYNNYKYFTQLSFEEKQEVDGHFSKNKEISDLTINKYKKLVSIIDNTSNSLQTKFNNIFTPSLMRGQGIYTKLVFQGYLDNENSSIFAGGEYKIGEYYCTGISIGVDFLSSVLDSV